MDAATNTKSNRRLWWIRVAAILWFLAGVVFLLSAPIVIQISIWIVAGIVTIAAVLAGIAALAVKRLKGGQLAPRWIKGTIALVFVLTAIVAFPVYYAATLTQVSPAMVPQAVLSNGDKTVVFQGMQHVGTEVFFKTVVYDLEDALSRGSVAYYEGVKPSNPADDAWFNTTITGGADLSNAYRDLGEVCGLHFQSDYFGLIGRDAKEHPSAHVVADVDTAQLHSEYRRLMRTDPAFANAMREREAKPAEEATDGLERIVDFLRSGSREQKETGAVLCRGYMTYASQRSHTDEIDKLILNYRNRVLADRLLSEPRRRIYVTYGAAHLPGVLALLQKADPRWKVQTIKWSRTIDYHETLTGKLRGLMTTAALLRVLVSLAAIAGLALPMSAPAAPPAAIAPPVQQVAADCAGSSYATDRLVCSDAELSALDQTLVRMLADLPSQYRSLDNPWLEDQQDWFKRRSLCAFDENHVECVRRAYHSRIAELGALASYTQDGASLRCPLLPGASRYTISPQGLMTIRDKQGQVLLVAWVRENKVWRPFVSYRWGRTKGRLTRQGDNAAMTCRRD